MEKVLKDDAVEEKGDRARMASFTAAMALAELTKATLGPKGMEKILQGRGRNDTVTNNRATILKSPHIDNPATKVPSEAVTTGLNVEAKKREEARKTNQEPLYKVLKDDDAVENKGDRARIASFTEVMAITELIKTTLGPKGMDKILNGRGRNVTITNDGATILKSSHIDNPAAKVPGEVVTNGLNVEAKKKKKRRGKKNKS